MSRGRRIALMSLLAVTLAAIGWLLRQEPDPDVFLITVDTLRADHLGCYGASDVRTPQFDRLAAGGLVFDNAVAPLPETQPAHYTLFTSLYPRDHGVLSNASQPVTSHLTLPVLFRAAGYATGGFAACSLFNGGAGARLGFESFAPSGTAQLAADQVVPKALDWLAGIDRRRPVFLWLHLFDPHLPYEPPAEFDRAAPSPMAERLPRISWDELTAIAAEHGGDLPREVLERGRELYRGEVEYTDHWLGRFFDGLRAAGRFESSAVLLTADHGECFENGVFFEHSTCLGEGALAVPLVLRHPRVAPGRSAATVELLDVAPTLLRLADLPVPEAFRGRGLLERRGDKRSDAFFQYPMYPLWEAAQRREWFGDLRSVAGEPVAPLVTDKPLAGVRRGRFKYLFLGDREALFDLESDPRERTDVAARHPEELRELRGVLQRWMAEHRPAPDSIRDLDPELLENLRALGYL